MARRQDGEKDRGDPPFFLAVSDLAAYSGRLTIIFLVYRTPSTVSCT